MTDLPTHRLTITATEPGQVFRVTDGRAARVAAGMFHMEIELPRGLYSVSAMSGRSVETRAVILNENRTTVFEQRVSSFGHQAFSQAPAVLEALAKFVTPADSYDFIAIRGPFKSKSAITGRPRVYAETEILPKGKGYVVDPGGGVWAYARYILPKKCADTLTVTRPVADGSFASHVLPCLSGGRVWCAYPAADPKLSDEAAVPLPHFLRLRLTALGEVPSLHTQSLSDVVFTALAGRAPLPFTREVLDLLFAADADPLLALAAAHVASIALARKGLVASLAADSSQISSGQTDAEARNADDWPNGTIEPGELAKRVRSWLDQFGDLQLQSSPDFIALRQIFGLPNDATARISTAPVLLRSLDALLERSDRLDTPVVDDAIWLDRLQVSDTFAYLQWDPEQDAQAARQELFEQAVIQSEQAARFVVRKPEPRSAPLPPLSMSVAVSTSSMSSGFALESLTSGAILDPPPATAVTVSTAEGFDRAHAWKGAPLVNAVEKEAIGVSEAVKRSAANLRIPAAHFANLALRMRNTLG